MKRLTIVTFALCLAAAGCREVDPFSAEARSNLDTRREPDGSVLVLDTRGNWKFLSSAIAAEVEREAQGLQPPGASASWTDYWKMGIAQIRSGQEHPERYFALVIELRRRASLPDLPRESIGS